MKWFGISLSPATTRPETTSSLRLCAPIDSHRDKYAHASMSMCAMHCCSKRVTACNAACAVPLRASFCCFCGADVARCALQLHPRIAAPLTPCCDTNACPPRRSMLARCASLHSSGTCDIHEWSAFTHDVAKRTSSGCKERTAACLLQRREAGHAATLVRRKLTRLCLSRSESAIAWERYTSTFPLLASEHGDVVERRRQ